MSRKIVIRWWEDGKRYKAKGSCRAFDLHLEKLEVAGKGNSPMAAAIREALVEYWEGAYVG